MSGTNDQGPTENDLVRPRYVPPSAREGNGRHDGHTNIVAPGANVRHLGDQVHEWVDTAVRAAAVHDSVWYDVSLAIVPSNIRLDTSRPGLAGVTMDASSTYVLTLFLPTGIIGSEPASTVKLIPDFPSEFSIRAVVEEAMSELRMKRAQALSLKRHPSNG